MNLLQLNKMATNLTAESDLPILTRLVRIDGEPSSLTFDQLAKRYADQIREAIRKIKTTEFAPGIPEKKRSELPVVRKPQTWEFSAHPHHADVAGPHIDMRLGNPETGVAHSFVLPKRTVLPGPGEAIRAIPTFDHTIPYMDWTGKIEKGYGAGVVEKGRRTRADVYHAEPGVQPGTKLRFNLYDGDHPEEFSLRVDDKNQWWLHNKTQTREHRADLPAGKPEYGEIDIDAIDAGNDQQALMPKLDGAHTLIDLRAGRAPRVFSYRVGKISTTGLIEHTHKLQRLLTYRVPKELDGTILRAETVGIDQAGKVIPAHVIGGLLNTKVWDSRRKQQETGVKLQSFPFAVVQHAGRSSEDMPFDEQVHIIEQVRHAIPEFGEIPVVTDPKQKIALLNAIKTKMHPLTSEGVVVVDKTRFIKAKIAPDWDVYARAVHPAVSKEGVQHDRAGSISYSWTPNGPVVGQLGGFRHEEARDMLANPDRYVGRVAKVRAAKRMSDSGALFQPRFKEWHLDKGDVEKQADLRAKSEVYVLDDKNRVLLAPSEGSLMAPGGGIEPGESPVQAARREVKEEVGLRVQDPVRLDAPTRLRWNADERRAMLRHHARHYSGSEIHPFVARVGHQDGSVLGADHDVMTGARFMPISQAIESLERTSRKAANPFRRFDAIKIQSLKKVQALLKESTMNPVTLSAFLGELGEMQKEAISLKPITQPVGKLFQAGKNKLLGGVQSMRMGAARMIAPSGAQVSLPAATSAASAMPKFKGFNMSVAQMRAAPSAEFDRLNALSRQAASNPSMVPQFESEFARVTKQYPAPSSWERIKATAPVYKPTSASQSVTLPPIPMQALHMA